MTQHTLPLPDRIRGVHDHVERASIAHAVMTLESAGSSARDDATRRYVEAMDAIFDTLDALRRSGELGGIETLLRRHLA